MLYNVSCVVLFIYLFYCYPERSDDRRAFAYKDWKAADWVKDQRESDYEFVQDRGVVKILKKGLYFIYSQVFEAAAYLRYKLLTLIYKEYLYT